MSRMLYFFAAFIISLILTWLVRQAALRLKVVDKPDKGRHLHLTSVPLLGGVAIFCSFWAVVIYLVYHPILGVDILTKKLVVAFAVSFILLLIGLADEIRPFSAVARLALTAVAVFIAAFGGFGLGKITNPSGGFFELSLWVGNLLVFFWLLGMVYTTKILDGLDGLSAGICAIGALMIILITQTAKFYQPNVGLVATIFLGVCLGFLAFNFHPAKIFLGESGSLLVGFILGVLAVIGGGKLATALLVMAVPILDLGRVIFERIKNRQSVFKGDRRHLFYLLVDKGVSHPKAVVILYLISFLFGITTLILPSYQKLAVLTVLLFAMLILGFKLNKKTVKI